jgi:hypothetical protein
VPLTEFCDVPVEVPGAPEVDPLEPALPELPDEPPLDPPPPPPPPCPSASETGVSRIAVTSTIVFDRMIFLLLKATHGVVTRSVETTIGVFAVTRLGKVDRATELGLSRAVHWNVT